MRILFGVFRWRFIFGPGDSSDLRCKYCGLQLIVGYIRLVVDTPESVKSYYHTPGPRALKPEGRAAITSLRNFRTLPRQNRKIRLKIMMYPAEKGLPNFFIIQRKCWYSKSKDLEDWRSDIAPAEHMQNENYSTQLRSKFRSHI